MAEKTLAAALEKEHRDIDGGIEEYTESISAGGGDPEPLRRSMAGLRRHIYLEEVFLFPPMRAGMMMAIMVMLREHGELWDSMDEIERMLDQDTDDATRQNACRELLALLDKHNSKEEPIIYTQADDVLSAEASGELADFLDSGTMPEGWVCEQAGGKYKPNQDAPKKLPWS